MFLVGFTNAVSSSVPDVISTKFGKAVALSATVEPQLGQKWHSIGWPLPPGRAYILLSPTIVKVSFGIITSVANAVPAWRWQLLQWHTHTNAGSASALYVSLP